MFFQLNELLRWLGLTAFEIFTALVCFLVFTVLVTLKVRGRDICTLEVRFLYKRLREYLPGG